MECRLIDYNLVRVDGVAKWKMQVVFQCEQNDKKPGEQEIIIYVRCPFPLARDWKRGNESNFKLEKALLWYAEEHLKTNGHRCVEEPNFELEMGAPYPDFPAGFCLEREKIITIEVPKQPIGFNPKLKIL